MNGHALQKHRRSCANRENKIFIPIWRFVSHNYSGEAVWLTNSVVHAHTFVSYDFIHHIVCVLWRNFCIPLLIQGNLLLVQIIVIKTRSICCIYLVVVGAPQTRVDNTSRCFDGNKATGTIIIGLLIPFDGERVVYYLWGSLNLKGGQCVFNKLLLLLLHFRGIETFGFRVKLSMELLVSLYTYAKSTHLLQALDLEITW